jgi:hypothetical protein
VNFGVRLPRAVRRQAALGGPRFFTRRSEAQKGRARSCCSRRTPRHLRSHSTFPTGSNNKSRLCSHF